MTPIDPALRAHTHERIEHEHTGYPFHVHELAAEAAPLDAWNERNAPDREADAFRAGLATGRAEAAPLDHQWNAATGSVAPNDLQVCAHPGCPAARSLAALAAPSREARYAQELAQPNEPPTSREASDD